MTKDLAKACRIMCGYTANLRVKLPVDVRKETCYETAISQLLLDRLVCIYGAGIYDRIGVKFNPQPGDDCDDYEKVLEFVGSEARRVCLCDFDEH